MKGVAGGPGGDGAGGGVADKLTIAATSTAVAAATPLNRRGDVGGGEAARNATASVAAAAPRNRSRDGGGTREKGRAPKEGGSG